MIMCVLRTAQMLQSYAKDLLDRALIENGTMKPNRTIDRISKVVNQCVEIARFQSDSRKVTIEVCHKGDVASEPLVLVDVQRITQVLFNLLTNALKFSERGGIVNVNILPLKIIPETNNATICLQVSDNGIGMTTKQSEQLFKPFSRGDDPESMRKNPGGNGLGLSICKQIMLSLDGDITCKSYRGFGTTFDVFFKTEYNNKLCKDEDFDSSIELSALSIHSQEQEQIE